MQLPKKSLVAGLLMWSGIVGATLPAESAGFGNDNVGCSVDRPCFTRSYQSGNRVIFQFDGVRGWDFYNVRYAQVGGGEKQVENRSGAFTFNNTQPNRVYKIKVQGCKSHTFGRSTCSPWAEESVTTR
jgi:hypothetical protein